MQAVILAAGVGKRLMPLTKENPKVLVSVNGVPILIRSLDHLANLKTVNEVIIVTGYKQEKIREAIGDNYKSMKITYIENTDYDITNNIYSLWMARDYIKNDFILLEGDVLFDFRLLEKLVEEGKDKALVAKYDQTWMDGTVVTIDKEKGLIKNLIPKSQQDSDFDYSDKYKTINIYYFTKEFHEKYFKPSLNFYVWSTGKNNYYELILGTLVYMDVPIFAEIIGEDLKWMEVDDLNDLEIAKEIFAEDKTEHIDKIFKLYGGYWRYKFLDFCYLYNLYFPSDSMFGKMNKALPNLINNYPSSQKKICNLLSRWYKEDNFNEENLIVGNGTSEIIRILNKNLVKKITIPVPTFNEYENKLNPEQINYYRLSEEDNFHIDHQRFVKLVKESESNFALIINPNNPTGTLETKEKIENILIQLPDVNLIVDESFIDFTEDREKYSVQDLVGKYPNLIIIRSISKEFGVPGLRLGYLLTTNQKIKEKVKEHLPIWNINSIAEFFLEIFIKYELEYKNSIKRIIEDKNNFLKSLNEISFVKCFPSSTNFILCKLDGIGSRKLMEILYSKYDILIKDCSNKENLENDKFIRISVRKKEDNDKLIFGLKEIDRIVKQDLKANSSSYFL